MDPPRKKKARKEPRRVILTDDISNGQEPVPISVVNETGDGDTIQDSFVYINKYVCRDVRIWSMERQHLFGPMVACECKKSCKTGTCECGKKCAGSALFYDEDGRLLDTCTTIRECSSLCKCNPRRCKNRTMQKGITKKLQIFKTKEKGWGVRTLEPLKKGDFICEYYGEVISQDLSEWRNSCEDDADAYYLTLTVDEESEMLDYSKIDYPSSLDEMIDIEDPPKDKGGEDLLKEKMKQEQKDNGLMDQVKFTQKFLEEYWRSLSDIEKEEYNMQAERWNEIQKKKKKKKLEIYDRTIPKKIFFDKMNHDFRMKNRSIPRSQFQNDIQHRGLLDLCNLDKLVENSSLLVGVAARSILQNQYVSNGEKRKGKLKKLLNADFKVSTIQDKFVAGDSTNHDNMTLEQQEKLQEQSESKDKSEFEGEVLVDARRYGSVARFLNHTCKPYQNCTKTGVSMCQMISFKLKDKKKNSYSIQHVPFTRMGLFANRDIKPFEELTWDYGYNSEMNKQKTGKIRLKCRCGTKNCRKNLLFH